MPKYLNLLLFFSVLGSVNLYASSILKDQLNSSSGVIEGHVSASNSTKVSIMPTRWIGVELQGGKEITVATHNELSVNVGEHILVFLDNKEIYQGAKGAYSIKRVGVRNLLVNKFRGVNPLESQYDLNRFYKLVEKVAHLKVNKTREHYKIALAKQKVHFQLRSNKHFAERKIASIENNDVVEKSNKNILWTLVLMCFLAAIVRKIHRQL